MGITDRFRPERVGDADKEIRAMESRYRTLFASAGGSAVFADILDRLDFFEPAITDEQTSRHNFAVELLKMAKVILPGPDGRASNVNQLVSQLLTERKDNG